MNRIGYITAILLAVLLCGSCINEEYAGPDPDLPTRTIIVYLGGDNNLWRRLGARSRPCGRDGLTPGTSA